MQQFIQSLTHNPTEPIRLERGADDTVIIDGVTFQANFFRALRSDMSDKVLYMIDKQGRYHIVRTLREAALFFAPELVASYDDEGHANDA